MHRFSKYIPAMSSARMRQGCSQSEAQALGCTQHGPDLDGPHLNRFSGSAPLRADACCRRAWRRRLAAPTLRFGATQGSALGRLRRRQVGAPKGVAGGSYHPVSHVWSAGLGGFTWRSPPRGWRRCQPACAYNGARAVRVRHVWCAARACQVCMARARARACRRALARPRRPP